MLKKRFSLLSMLKAVIYISISGFFDEYKVQQNSIYLKKKAFVYF